MLEQPKVRGRPFQKGNKQGKMECHILDNEGNRKENIGGVKDPHTLKKSHGQNKVEIEVLASGREEEMKKYEHENGEEEIDFLEFGCGQNTMKIKFTKKHSRNFKITVVLNDEIEVRPTSFITKQSANNSWDMLKRVLKK